MHTLLDTLQSVQIGFSLVGLFGSFTNDTQIKLRISGIKFSTRINAWTDELAYYARHSVSSQCRVQELDVSLRHPFAL